MNATCRPLEALKQVQVMTTSSCFACHHFFKFFFVVVKAHHPLQVWRLTQVMTMSNTLACCHSSSFPKELK